MIRYDENLSERYGIKLLDHKTVLKEARLGTKESWECMQAIARHFMLKPDPMVVPIYSFELIEGPKDPNNSFGVNYTYQYTMKRLGMLNDGEKELIMDMKEVSIYGAASYGKKSSERLVKTKDEYPELFSFMEVVLSQKRYWDIHSGNFLRDEDESYKIIDLEGFIHTPLNREENNWLTR